MNVSCPQCSTVYRVDPAKVPVGGVRARCSSCSAVISVGMQSHSSRPTPGRTTPVRPTPSRPTPSRPTPPLPPSARPTPAEPVQARSTPVDPLGAAFSARPSPPGPFVAPARPATQQSPQLGASLPPLRPTPRTAWHGVGASMPVTQTPAAPTPEEEAAVPSLAPTLSIPAISVHSLTPSSPYSDDPASAGAAAHPVQSVVAAPPAMVPGDRRPVNPFLTRDPGIRAKRLARALVSDMIAYYPAKHAEGLEKGTLKDLFRDEIKKSYEEYIAQVGADLARTTTHFQESLNEVLGAGKKIF